MTDKNRKKLRFTEFDREWEILKLGDVIDIASASRVHKNEWTTEGVRFFRSSDVTAKFFGKANVPAYISLELYENLSKRSGAVRKGDILITGGGTIGIPYLINDDQPIYFKDADLIWLKSHNIIDGYFLYTYFTSQFLREYIASISHIGTISHYTIEQAKATPIKLPKLEEQKKIGSFFKSLDDTISFHQQELEALKQTKQGFLQKMFPKDGETVPEVRLKNFVESWREVSLGAISDSYSGGTPSAGNKKYYNGTIPFIRSAEINSSTTELFLTEEGLNNSSAKLVKKGTILYAMYGATSGEVGISRIDGAINQAILAIKPKEEYAIQFLYQYLKKSKKSIVNSYLQGGQGNLSGAIIKKISIWLPESREEQVEIGEFFRQLDEVIELKEKELEALKETKRGFLQKMFV